MISAFESLVLQVVDMQTNRINKNINFVERSIVLLLPPAKSFTIKEFETVYASFSSCLVWSSLVYSDYCAVSQLFELACFVSCAVCVFQAQQRQIELVVKVFESKNVEVERAVNDMIGLITAHVVSPTIPKPDTTTVQRVKLSYQYRMRRAFAQATRNSLNALKRRLSQKCTTPLFDVDLSLQIPDVLLTPSLADVQACINTLIVRVLHCSKSLHDWGLEPNATQEVIYRAPRSFYPHVRFLYTLVICSLLCFRSCLLSYIVSFMCLISTHFFASFRLLRPRTLPLLCFVSPELRRAMTPPSNRWWTSTSSTAGSGWTTRTNRTPSSRRSPAC